MRYLILGTLALACAVAASLPAHADVCDQPIPKLTVAQIDNCKMQSDSFRRWSQMFDEAKANGIIDEAKAKEPKRTPSEQECLDAYHYSPVALPGCVYALRGGEVTVRVFPPR